MLNVTHHIKLYCYGFAQNTFKQFWIHYLYNLLFQVFLIISNVCCVAVRFAVNCSQKYPFPFRNLPTWIKYVLYIALE